MSTFYKITRANVVKAYTLLTLFVICVMAIWAYKAQLPSTEDYNSADVKLFSQSNAFKHVKQIATEPHYLGSEAHTNVRQYIVKSLQDIGLHVEIFEQQATRFHRYYMSANTRNIIAKIPGSSSGKQDNKALAIVSHYDSGTHSSLGASDAGSGVAVIIEGVRAFLANNTQPKNDIFIVLTDGEEKGLLGAQAFVDYHPWAKEIAVVLNFEARGSGGPSYMLLETNGGNKKLVEAFSNADIQHPASNSLMYSIYKMLPNDTDLTVFRKHGNIQGFNFAFIDDHFDYHTMQDNVHRLDKDTLNHQADYLMALLNYFATNDLTQLNSTVDLVYFNLPLVGMVHYPFSWALPLVCLAAMLFLLIIIWGIKKQILSCKGIVSGLTPMVGALIASGVIGYYGWQLLLILFPQYAENPHNFTYNGHWILASFIALTLAITMYIYHYFSKSNKTTNLLIGPIFLWIVLNAGISLKLIGASFLVIPVFSALASLSVYIFTVQYLHKYKGVKNTSLPGLLFFVVLTSILLPVVLITPLIPAFVIGLGLKALFIGTLFTCLLTILLLPLLLNFIKVETIAHLCVFVAFVFYGISISLADYSAENKKPNSINYIVDHDKGQAFWASSNQNMDEFISQFFIESKKEIEKQETKYPSEWEQSVYPNARSAKVRLFKQVKAKPMDITHVDIIEDKQLKNGRHFTVHITPQEHTDIIQFASDDKFKITSMRINGQLVAEHGKPVMSDHKGGFFLWHTISASNELLIVEFTVKAQKDFNFKVYETSYNLYEQFKHIKPRSNIFMPEPFIINDAVIIGQIALKDES